jgi:hypothetical protein
MSFNGSGSFLINTAGQPVVSGTVISSTAFNALTADLATGLSTCITKDGQTTVTANIPMANYKFTGLGVGSGAADSANLSQVQSTVVKLLASVSGTDTITAVGSPTVAAYAAGQMFYFVAAGDNTGAVTINIDSLGAKAVTRDGSVALAAGDIKSGEVVVVVYDGTRFQVVSQLNSSGDARFANVSIASALNVGGVATVTGGSVLNGGVVINEPGADVDFRVEGDTDANLIFADASTDRVGFGTNTPGAKTEIYVNRTSSTNAVAINLNDNVTGAQTDGVYKAIRSLSNNGASISEIRFMETDGSNNNTSIAFATQATANALTERMRINQAGNLGLGVTPSAWGSIFNAMQLGDGGFIAGRSDTATQLQLGCNGFYDGSNFKYIVTGTATRYYMDTGAHYWENAASGTAGNTITFTTAMVLDASGNLYVGGTTGAFGGSQKGVSAQSGSVITVLNGESDNSIGSTGTISNHAFTFKTNGTERARLTAGGALLVNATALSGTGIFQADHSVNDQNIATFRNTGSSSPYGNVISFPNATPNNTTNYFLLCTDSTNAKCYIYSSGTVTNRTGTYNAISDIKLKQDIVDAGSQWNDIKALRVRKFRLKDEVAADQNYPAYIGLIAQEAELVSPGLIDDCPDFETVETTDENGNVKQERKPTGTVTKSVKYSILYMKAVKALQEAMARIEKLEAEVAALKGA